MCLTSIYIPVSQQVIREYISAWFINNLCRYLRYISHGYKLEWIQISADFSVSH